MDHSDLAAQQWEALNGPDEPAEGSAEARIEKLEQIVDALSEELQRITECRACYGHGNIRNDECPACFGTGRNPKIEQD